MLQRQRKPRGGDRNRCRLKLNKLDILSPLRGFCFADAPVPGVLPFGQAQAEYTPVCVLSHLRCFSPEQQYLPKEPTLPSVGIYCSTNRSRRFQASVYTAAPNRSRRFQASVILQHRIGADASKCRYLAAHRSDARKRRLLLLSGQTPPTTGRNPHFTKQKATQNAPFGQSPNLIARMLANVEKKLYLCKQIKP